MPKYDYRCSACGSEYEKRESFSAPPVQECISCTGEARRILRPPAIVFKGSGWYKTDSRGSVPSESSTSTSPSKTDDSGSTSSSETPAAAAAD